MSFYELYVCDNNSVLLWMDDGFVLFLWERWSLGYNIVVK